MKAKPSMPHRVDDIGASRRLARGAACAAAAMLAACASSGPPVHLYSLMPAEPPALVAPAAATPTPVMLAIRLPSQVEQPQLLVRLPDDSMMSLEQERWASPLRDEMRQALFEELGARFGIGEAHTATGAAPVRVSVDVRRFDSVVGKEARIEGSWNVSPSVAAAAGRAEAGQRCEWLYREPAGGAVGALPDAHRRLVVRLADAIGAAVVAAGSGSPAPCPTSDAR